MKKLLGLLLGVATAVALISCGGSGAGAPLSATGRAVQSMQKFSFLSMGNSGFGFLGFGGGGGGAGTSGGTTGSSNGGGGGSISSIGGFVRNFGGPNGIGPAMVRRHLAGGTTGGDNGSTGGSDGGSTSSGTDGGNGGGTGQNFYYDEWLQLWVDTEWTETTFTSNFYLDEAKQLSAGHIVSTFVNDWEVFPQTYTSEYEFTAGPWTGSSGTYNSTQVSWSEGSMIYQNTYSDGSHDNGSASWNETTSSWSSRWDGPSSRWYEDSGTWGVDGGDYSCSNSDGWSSTWHYNADWSGNAHFEGPDPLLPANMTWTVDGRYRIVYADGTVETWSWEDLWEDGGEGTTGSNSSTGGGFFAPRAAKAGR